MKPFDLEMALKGEPVQLRDGRKAFIKAIIKQPKGLEHYTVIGHALNGIHEEFLHWDINGNCIPDDMSDDDIVGMWEDPKRYVNGIEVPESVTEETWVNGGHYWYPTLDNTDQVRSDRFYTDVPIHTKLIRQGLVFKTLEDARIMAKALLNYKVEQRDE